MQQYRRGSVGRCQASGVEACWIVAGKIRSAEHLGFTAAASMLDYRLGAVAFAPRRRHRGLELNDVRGALRLQSSVNLLPSYITFLRALVTQKMPKNFVCDS
jgi:hypothetical protein